MNISRHEQRARHVLAPGGRAQYERDDTPQTTAATCASREGMVLADCDLTDFNLLRRKRLIDLRLGSPSRISKRDLITVRSQLDNQGA